MNSERIAEAMGETLRKPCFVCDAPPPAYVVGTFTPKGDFALECKVPKGKTRVCTYSLCKACFERSKSDGGWVRDFVEARIRAMCRGETIVWLDGNGWPIVGDPPPGHENWPIIEITHNPK